MAVKLAINMHLAVFINVEVEDTTIAKVLIDLLALCYNPSNLS